MNTKSMNKNLRKNIVDHLNKKGNYDPNVDDYLIDILIENIQFAEASRHNIENYGLMIRAVNGNGFETNKENPAFGTYVKCLQNIHQTSAKLGISRNDRLKLKLLEEKTKDDFDNDFS